MAKVLITGGAGFIGSHLADSLLRNGDEVTVLDDLSTGSLANLDAARSSYGRRLHVEIGSVLSKEELNPLIRAADQVYHLAAAVGVSTILDRPLESMHVNIQGTENVLAACAEYGKKVLVASTSEVYGKHLRSPLRETDDCILGSPEKSRWSYAASKLIDEFASLAYASSRDLDVRIVRFFNIVGPRQSARYGMVLPRFVRQALAGEPLTVFGDGAQTRTFTLVGDAVRCVTGLMASAQARGQIVNIGGVEEVSIHELAQRVIAFFRSSSEIRIIPYSEAYPAGFEDMPKRVPSTEKLESLIGQKPETCLDEILEQIAEASEAKKPMREAPQLPGLRKAV